MPPPTPAGRRGAAARLARGTEAPLALHILRAIEILAKGEGFALVPGTQINAVTGMLLEQKASTVQGEGLRRLQRLSGK